MGPMRAILAVTLAAAAVPAVAHAAEVTMTVRDLPLSPVRSVSGISPPQRFDLVGLHWRGPGDVVFRTRAAGGRWSAWRRVDSEEHVTAGTAEAARTRGWRLGEPYWTGTSTAIEYRPAGRVTRLRGYFVESPVERVAIRTMAIAGAPPIVPRVGWNADERIRRASPRYARALRFSVVHHTAGTNAYSAEESGAIVRGIEEYHVKGNGWNDIGYNFLVDRYGQVFEGRYGGVTRNVVGAHAGGFNTGSVGVAVLGTYSSTPVTPAARAALVKLLSWRLDLAYVDPNSTLVWPSRGNERFPAGTPVSLRAVSGHRDTGFTDCPGNSLYAQLPAIASSVARAGPPKIYDPSVKGSLGGPIRFSARLSVPGPWSVTVTSLTGAAVARGSGTGTAISWTWSSRAAAEGLYSWTIAAPHGTRPATGSLGAPAPSPAPPPLPRPPPTPPPILPPVLAELAATPALISPDGDANTDYADVTYLLRRAASVTATVIDESGAPLQTLFREQRQSARRQRWPWTALGIVDGRYTLRISARDDYGKTTRGDVAILVDRTLGWLAASPSVFSPNGDGRLDTITFTFGLAQPATVSIRILQAGRQVALLLSGTLAPGLHQVVWNGQTPIGLAPDGNYDLEVDAADSLASTSETVRFTVDSRVG